MVNYCDSIFVNESAANHLMVHSHEKITGGENYSRGRARRNLSNILNNSERAGIMRGWGRVNEDHMIRVNSTRVQVAIRLKWH